MELTTVKNRDKIKSKLFFLLFYIQNYGVKKGETKKTPVYVVDGYPSYLLCHWSSGENFTQKMLI